MLVFEGGDDDDVKEVGIFEGVVIEGVGVLEVDGAGVEMLEKSGKSSSSSSMELSAVDGFLVVVLDKSPQLAARFVLVKVVGELLLSP